MKFYNNGVLISQYIIPSMTHHLLTTKRDDLEFHGQKIILQPNVTV